MKNITSSYKFIIISNSFDESFELYTELKDYIINKKQQILKLCPTFTTNMSLDNSSLNELSIIDIENDKPRSYYLEYETINLSIKNNALLYVLSDKNEILTGITYDDFYENDVMILTYKEFNLLPNKLFKKNNILIIWKDSYDHDKLDYSESIEVNCFMSRIINESKYYKYLYFLGKQNDFISKIIVKYIDDKTTIQERQKLHEIYE